jgi:hypothetical protein
MLSTLFFLKKSNNTLPDFFKKSNWMLLRLKNSFSIFFLTQNTQNKTLEAMINIFETSKNPKNHHKTRNQPETKKIFLDSDMFF